MSGGAFNYIQWRIEEAVNDIERLIRNNNTPDEYGDCRNYSPEVIAKFKEGMKIIEYAAKYLKHIDWLLSCDDSEESFMQNIKEIEKKYHE